MVSGCLGAGLFDPHPLNESQAERLAGTRDGAATVDAAGVYALLENAADWSDKESGAVVPDYDAVRRDPAGWRGTRCLIEGTLERAIPADLKRTGWERVEGALVRVGGDPANPQPRDYVIVYLTDPPKWDWSSERRRTTRPATVRVVGRFYALSAYNSERAGSQTYAVFVGRSLNTVAAGAVSGGSGGGWGNAPLFFTLILVLIGFVAWRVKAAGGFGTPHKMQDYIERKERDRQREEARSSGEVEGGEDGAELPPDPTAALDALAEKHEKK